MYLMSKLHWVVLPMPSPPSKTISGICNIFWCKGISGIDHFASLNNKQVTQICKW